MLVGRVDPEFNTLGTVARIGNVVPDGPGAIATQGNSVWVAPSTGLLTRLERPQAKRPQLDPNASPAGIAVGEGAIWLTDPEAGNVVRVDPSGLLTPITVGNAPTGIAVGGGGVWVADSLDDAVVRIDPDTRSVTATIPVGRSPAGVAYGAGSVWVANSGDGTVTRIDPHTDKPQATITVGGSPQAITIADGKAWVTVDEQSIPPSRGAPDGGTLRLVSSSDVPSLDPATRAARSLPRSCTRPALSSLNYPDKAGPAGSQLIPEVAQSLPARSPDGRPTRSRSAPAFASRHPPIEPVTAQTFKDTIERTLNPGMHSVSLDLPDIVGAGAYMSGKASHIAGVIANGDTLTIRLPPPPDFLARLAQPAGSCAVPSNTPVLPQRREQDPVRRPLLRYVVHASPGGRADAQPQLPRMPTAPLRADRARRRDLPQARGPRNRSRHSPTTPRRPRGAGLRGRRHSSLPTPGSIRRRSAAAARGAQQYFANPPPNSTTSSSTLTGRCSAMSACARRSTTRSTGARWHNSGDGFVPLPAYPTDHYLPPGMPGFRDAHIYPMTPNVVKARSLAPVAVEQPCSTPATSLPAASRPRSSRPTSPRSTSTSRSNLFTETRCSRASNTRRTVRSRLGRLASELLRPRIRC